MQVASWSERFLPMPDYEREIVKVFFDAFRHSVAHRGIATGIWIDRRTNTKGERRVTWLLSELVSRPACRLVNDEGFLVNDPPWRCRHTHRMHIHLGALAEDLASGAAAYADELQRNPDLQRNFERCMRALYPS